MEMEIEREKETEKEVDEYAERLKGYSLSIRTKKEYYYYYKKLKELMLLIEQDLNEEIANEFLKTYPNTVCHAFLRDYIKFRKLSIVLESRTVNRKVKKQKHYISPEEIILVGKYMREHFDFKFYLMLNIAYHGALRKAETIGLNLKDIKLDLIRFKEDKTKPMRLTISKETAKGNKGRTVILPPKLANLLFNYIDKNREKIGTTSHINNIFRVKGDRWDAVFQEACLGALNRKQTLHELRFSKATYFFRVKGFDILTIKKILGHASIVTTQKYIDPEQESALRQVEALYGVEED